MAKKRKINIEKSMKLVNERINLRNKAGRDSFHVSWQAALETTLVMMEGALLEHPGQLLPMQIDGQSEWEFFVEVQSKTDLPPDTCAAFITPSASKYLLSFDLTPSIVTSSPSSWERQAYSLIISNIHDRTVIMQVSLPGIETVGIDIYEDANLLADYTYNSIEECLDDLSKTIWIYFKPGEQWTEDQIIIYTENWAKISIVNDIYDVPIHSEYSYVHHPDLLNLTPFESLFKVVQATIPEQFDDLDELIELANAINQDMESDDPIITRGGILNDKETECQALFDRITVEIDMHLETLRYIDDVKFPDPIKNEEYRQAFDQATRRIYEKITSRPCPKTLWIRW